MQTIIFICVEIVLLKLSGKPQKEESNDFLIIKSIGSLTKVRVIIIYIVSS